MTNHPETYWLKVRSTYLAPSAGWGHRWSSAGYFIWSHLGSSMHLWSAVGCWVVPLSGCWLLQTGWSRMALAGTMMLCSTWCLILRRLPEAHSPGGSRVLGERSSQASGGLASGMACPHWPLLTKASHEASSDSGVRPEAHLSVGGAAPHLTKGVYPRSFHWAPHPAASGLASVRRWCDTLPFLSLLTLSKKRE